MMSGDMGTGADVGQGGQGGHGGQGFGADHSSKKFCVLLYGLITIKPAFGVSDKARPKSFLHTG